jgi:hypothetical protein
MGSAAAMTHKLAMCALSLTQHIISNIAHYAVHKLNAHLCFFFWLITSTQCQGAAELAEALAKLRDESELAQRLSKRNSDLQGRLAAAAAERTEVNHQS